jgi:hypothetical protein
VQNELPYPAVIEPKLSEFDKFLEDPAESNRMPALAQA